MSNRYDELSNDLDLMAKHLELDGRHEAKAYRAAADTIRTTSFIPPDPSDLDGIGTSLREDIEEWRAYGSIERLERMNEERPWLVELTSVSGIGPKTAESLADAGIESTEELEEAIESGEILDVRGIGQKTADRLDRNL